MKLNTSFFSITSTKASQRTANIAGANIFNSSLGQNDQKIKKWGGGDAYVYDATNDIHIYNAPIEANGGFTDANVTTPVNLGDASNTSFKTTNQTIVGAVNELSEEIMFQSLIF